MPSAGDTVHLQLSSELDKPHLHPSKVVEAGPNALTVEVGRDECAPEEGQEILIYCNLRRGFVKQSARVTAVREPAADEDDQSKLLVEMEQWVSRCRRRIASAIASRRCSER